MVSSLHSGLFHLAFDERLYTLWRNRFAAFFRYTHIETSGLDRIRSLDAAILAPNHLNWKDIPLIGVLSPKPVSFVATCRLFDIRLCIQMLDEYSRRISRIPHFHELMNRINLKIARFLVSSVRNVGAIPARFQAGEYSMLEILRWTLRQRRLVCIFPEGRTGSLTQLNRFKPGLPRLLYEYRTLYHFSIPVLPVGITGTHHIYRPGMKLRVHIGKPMTIDPYIQPKINRTLASFSSDLQERIIELMNSG